MSWRSLTRKHSRPSCLERWWDYGAATLTSWNGQAFAGTKGRSASRLLSTFPQRANIPTPTSRLTLSLSNSSANTTRARDRLRDPRSEPGLATQRGRDHGCLFRVRATVGMGHLLEPQKVAPFSGRCVIRGNLPSLSHCNRPWTGQFRLTDGF